MKLSRKSENAVADDQVLKFLYDADLRHVESSVRCHRKYKNGRIKGDLGFTYTPYLGVDDECDRRTDRTAASSRVCKLFSIRLYATLCFNYFR